MKMVKEKIAAYVRENLLRGFRVEVIREQLLKHKYPVKDVDAVIEVVKKEHVLKLAKYINKELKLGFKPVEIRNYLVSIGHKKETVDDALTEILLAKRRLLRKRSVESVKEHFFSYWDHLRPWQKGGFVAGVPVLLISFFSIVWMMLVTVSDSGKLNCYSLGRVITCSLTESVIFYALLFLAFVIIFCLPAFIIGAVSNHLIWRFRK